MVLSKWWEGHNSPQSNQSISRPNLGWKNAVYSLYSLYKWSTDDNITSIKEDKLLKLATKLITYLIYMAACDYSYTPGPGSDLHLNNTKPVLALWARPSILS